LDSVLENTTFGISFIGAARGSVDVRSPLVREIPKIARAYGDPGTIPEPWKQ